MHLYVYLVISNAFVYVMKLRWFYHVAQAVLELILFLTCNHQILGLQAKISVLKKSLASHHGEIPFNPSVGGRQQL